MASIFKILSYFLVTFAFVIAKRNQTKIEVGLARLIHIQDGSNPINHFVPQPDPIRLGKYNVALGLPPRGLRWMMWRASSNPIMCIFGIQIKNEWYFMQVRRNVILVKQNVPNLLLPTSSRWFEYGEVAQRVGINVLRHKKSQAFLTINNSTIGISRNPEVASEIAIYEN